MKKNLLANNSGELGNIGGPGLGPFGRWWEIFTGDPKQQATAALKSLTTIISNIIGVITIAAGVWFMFQFIIAGFGWLTAGGNKEAVSTAQTRMRNALIGLLIVVGAITIVGLMGELLGLDILIQRPEKLIEQLRPGG